MWRQLTVCVAALLVLLFGWEGYCLAHPEQALIIPSPFKVFHRVIFHSSSFLVPMWVTLKEMLGGLLLAVVFAFPLGWLMSKKVWTRPLIQSFFVFFQCLPMFTLAPLMILWFGWSYVSILIPTALMIVFPLTLTFYRGLCATPQESVDFFKAHDATESQIFFKLKIPYALPHIFSGLRVSCAMAGIGAIAGEWAGAQEGLGVYIQECRRSFDMEALFGALGCLVLLSFAFYGLIHLVERVSLKGYAYELS
jgi:ABC-type nitrate/sulfonate/bicarbonate transport system permease component